jgi:hypothetical protein
MHAWYIQIQSHIAAVSFGVIYAIIRELHTKILNLLNYNSLQK